MSEMWQISVIREVEVGDDICGDEAGHVDVDV